MRTIGGVGALIFSMLIQAAFCQNYTSLHDGSWTTAANWNNTSGWGTATPPLDGSHGSGTITMQNNLSITGNYSTGSPTLNIVSGYTLTVNGNLTETGGAAINVYGTLVVTGDLSLSSILTVYPGGKVIVNGSTYVVSSNNLVIGTSATPPPYADMVIRQNLVSQTSGDITLNKNSRLAVFGNVTDSGGGGTILQLNDGAEMYINGNVTYTGGGDHINNSNTVNPYGLYVNGTVTNSGGGSGTTANKGNKLTMQTTNPTFYSWIASQPGSPLPVTLVYFKVLEISGSGIELEWMTASELNLDHYEIEKSSDGKNFAVSGRMTGHGTTAVAHTYQWQDNNPLVGTNYYRLKSIDVDGTSEYFTVVMATMGDARNAEVYPNPVADLSLHIDLNFKPENESVAMLYDVFGALRESFTLSESTNQLRLSVGPGTYILKVRSGPFETIRRLSVP